MWSKTAHIHLLLDMIYNVVALPGRFSVWCERLVYELAKIASAPPPFRSGSKSKSQAVTAPPPELPLIFGDSLAHIGRELLIRNCPHAVILSHHPFTDTCNALKDAGRPFLLVLDDPDAAVAALVRDLKYEYPAAVRFLASASTSLLDLVSVPHALVLRRRASADLEATARAIAKHFEFDSSKAFLQGVMAQPYMSLLATQVHDAMAIEPAGAAAGDTDLPARLATDVATGDLFRGHRLTPILEGAIEPLWRVLQGGELGDIVWSRELFVKGDNPKETAAQPISLTGPSRCLVFGPFLRLPRGSWSCRVIFACDEHAVGTPMMADVFSGVQLAHAQFKLSGAGVFEIEFPFVNENPDAPLEIRLLNLTAALDGHVALGEVRLSPLEFRRLPVTQ